MNSLIPFNERDRLKALFACQILDTQVEARFDDITARAVKEFGVSTCAFGLIDSDRYWVKSSVSLDFKEADRSVAFCANVVANNTPVVLEDTLKDRIFASHPLVVGSRFVRFYAGFPVCAGEGHAVGAFCIMHPSPRRLPWEDYLALQKYAQEIENELTSRSTLRM